MRQLLPFTLNRFDCVAEGNPAPSVFWTKEVRMQANTAGFRTMLISAF